MSSYVAVGKGVKVLTREALVQNSFINKHLYSAFEFWKAFSLYNLHMVLTAAWDGLEGLGDLENQQVLFWP